MEIPSYQFYNTHSEAVKSPTLTSPNSKKNNDSNVLNCDHKANCSQTGLKYCKLCGIYMPAV